MWGGRRGRGSIIIMTHKIDRYGTVINIQCNDYFVADAGLYNYSAELCRYKSLTECPDGKVRLRHRYFLSRMLLHSVQMATH